jgi:hypothetical protein
MESIEPPTINPAAPIDDVSGTVDWAAEARQAAAAVTDAPKNRLFGQHPNSDTHLPEIQRRSPHYAGEHYTDAFGSHVVWISDSCYVVSDPPLPGTPHGLNMSRMACIDFSNPAGELFKDLPAYKKYHPE